MKPPNFNGDNVIDFIFKINQYLDALDDTAGDNEKITFTSTLLVGRAGKWWRYKKENDDDTYMNFKEFTDDLYTNFVDIDHLNILREKADNLSQKPKQSV